MDNPSMGMFDNKNSTWSETVFKQNRKAGLTLVWLLDRIPIMIRDI